MKAKFLLTALALPAIFAACTNEELVEAENQQPVQEIVGANLISKGLTINVGGGVESRLTENNQWTLTDKLGLGWLNASESIYDVQKGGVKDTDHKLYANHMFQLEAEGGDFTTYGNVYEGYHFAYYPYARMSQVGKKVVDYIEVNNVQTEDYKTDRHNRALYLSPQIFLTNEDVDGDKLVTNKSFELKKVTNYLALATSISEDIRNAAPLAALSVKEVKIQINGKYPFVKKAELQPRLLPVATYNETKGEMVLSTAWTKKNLMGTDHADATKAIKPSTSASSFVSTILEGEFASLSNELIGVNMFTFPTVKVAALDEENPLTVTFETAAGLFTISYEKDAEEGTVAAANNKQIEKLVALLSTGYGDDKVTLHETMGLGVNLAFQLNKSMFTPEYGYISNEDEWNQCVAISNALGENTVTFTVDKSFAFAGAIATPNAANFYVETLDGQAITVGTEAGVEWSNKIKVAAGKKLVVNVDEGTVLNVAGTQTAPAVMNATSIVNKGTINVNEWAAVANKERKALNNEEGRVIVKFNAFVYAVPGKEGTIAYEVENTTKENISKMNLLMQGTDLNEYANVNTLIVKTDLDLNAVASEQVENNRYESITEAKFLSSLANINIELEGGSLSKVLAGANNKVKNIVATEGTNTLNVGVKVVNNVTVAEDATLTIANAEGYNDRSLLLVNDLKVEGTLNVNKSVLTTNIYETESGDIKVAKNYGVFYQTNYQQDGSTQGTIEKKVVTKVTGGDFKTLQSALDNAKDGSIILVDGVYSTTNEKILLNGNRNGNIRIVGISDDAKLEAKGKYGLFVQNEYDPKSNLTVLVQDLEITSSKWAAVYVKYNTVVDLYNVKTNNNIHLDNANSYVGDLAGYYAGTKTTVNAYNVTLVGNAKCDFIALPTASSDKVTYTEFNFVGGNITTSKCEAIAGNKGTGNIFVNGQAIN